MQRIALVVLIMLTVGCATGGRPPRRIVSVETKKPIELRSGVGRIAVTVGEDVTIFEIDERRFSCRGYEGYVAQAKIANGWVRIGRLEFVYDAETIQLRAPTRWSTYGRGGRSRLVVQQDGTTGRSVFRD